MSDHIHEQISAFLDDELSAEESAFLVRRLSSDALARQQTVRFATIGSVLREEAVLSNSSVLRERIQAVLDGAAVAPAATRVPTQQPRHWARAAAGVGVAAAVAVFALVGLRAVNDNVPVTGDVRAPVAGIETWAEPDSYVVPGDTNQATQITVPPIMLTNLLMQHGNYASTLNRTAVHSNVIGEPEPTEQTVVEMEEP